MNNHVKYTKTMTVSRDARRRGEAGPIYWGGKEDAKYKRGQYHTQKDTTRDHLRYLGLQYLVHLHDDDVEI